MSNSIKSTPLLGSLGPLAADYGEFIRLYPQLLTRLYGSSVEHFHVLAVAGHTLTGALHSVAKKLCETEPRELLREAIPDHAPELMAALRQMGPVMHDLHHYQRANTLLKTGVARQLVRVAQAEPEGITPELLDRFEAIMQSDPLVTAAAHAIRSAEEVLAFHTWVLVLRGYKLLTDEREEARSLSQIGRGGLASWIGKRLTRATTPCIGFQDTSDLFMVRDLGQLKALGNAMQNCLRADVDYHLRALRGDLALFHYVGRGGPVAISLCRLAPGIYAVEEIAAKGNGDVRSDVADQILALLCQGGILIAPETMRQANHKLGFGYGNRW
jgi:hypothetical protein